MKDKKFLILIVFSVFVGFIILYSSRPLKKSQLSFPVSGSGGGDIRKQELQLKQLQDILNAFVGLHVSLKKDFEKGKEELQNLKEELQNLKEKEKKYISRNEILRRQLAEAKVKLELTEPIRERLKELNDTLVNLQLRPRQKRELSKALRSIDRKLRSIERLIPNLIKENRFYKREAQALSKLLDEKKEVVALLEQQVKEDRVEKKSLEKELNLLSERLRIAGNAKSLLEKQLADLRNNTEDLKASNYSLRSKNIELEKRLSSLKAEIEQIDKEREIIAKELEKTRIISENAHLLVQELTPLKAQLEELNKEYANLKFEYSKSQEMLKNNEVELGKRADRILNLEEELSELQSKLVEVELSSKVMKRDTAILREQYVAVQLERQSLMSELKQANLRLSKLQDQVQQVVKIFNIPLETAIPPTKEVEVELLP